MWNFYLHWFIEPDFNEKQNVSISEDIMYGLVNLKHWLKGVSSTCQIVLLVSQHNSFLSHLIIFFCRFLKKLYQLSYLDVHGGYIDPDDLRYIQENLGARVEINKFKFSSVARPTVGLRRSSIWNMRVRDID